MKQGERITVGPYTWKMQVSRDKEPDTNDGTMHWIAVAILENHRRHPELENVFWQRRGHSPEHAKTRLMDFIYWRITMIGWVEL